MTELTLEKFIKDIQIICEDFKAKQRLYEESGPCPECGNPRDSVLTRALRDSQVQRELLVDQIIDLRQDLEIANQELAELQAKQKQGDF